MNKYKALVIGGSVGSFPLVVKILSNLPTDFPVPIFLALHRLKHIRHGLLETLNIKSNIKIVEPNDKEVIQPSYAYLAPANYHMFIEPDKTIALSTQPMVKFSRPAIDLTFETAAFAYNDSLIGVILSGANTDGANGIAEVKIRGGLAIVQNPDEAGVSTMPKGAISATNIDYVLNVDEIIKKLIYLMK
jgi:two-component system chemotaxis response regulator CheB